MSAGVYRHFSAAGELLYVGCSSNPLDRSAQHRQKSPWFKEVTKITIQWFDSRAEALAAEADAIFRERPRENVNNMRDGVFIRQRRATRKAKPIFSSEKPHPQLDAINREYNLPVFGHAYYAAGFTTARLNQLRESGDELLASEVTALARSIPARLKDLEIIGIHRKNPG